MVWLCGDVVMWLCGDVVLWCCAGPLVGVPFDTYFISVFVGLMPYNFICVNAGTLLTTLSSVEDVLNLSTLLRLACIAFVALLPALYRRYMQQPTLHKHHKSSAHLVGLAPGVGSVDFPSRLDQQSPNANGTTLQDSRRRHSHEELNMI